MITKERVTIIASMTAARTPILSKSVRMWPYVVEASSSGLGPVRELCPRAADRDATEVLETMARRSATLTPTRCESSLRVASGRPAGRGAGFTATVSAPRLSDEEPDLLEQEDVEGIMGVPSEGWLPWSHDDLIDIRRIIEERMPAKEKAIIEASLMGQNHKSIGVTKKYWRYHYHKAIEFIKKELKL